MTTKTITICGREVTLAYCNQTEIAFKMQSDRNILDFFTDDVFPSINAKPARMPDMKTTIHLVLAAIDTYYDYIGQDSPVTDRELKYEAGPNDIPAALLAVIEIYGNFYATPKDEPEDGEEEDTQKNA